MRVEQIARDRVVQIDRGLGHLDNLDVGHDRPDRGVGQFGIGEGELVAEQDVFVGDRNDVVVERAAADRHVGLSDEQGAHGIESVKAGYCP